MLLLLGRSTDICNITCCVTSSQCFLLLVAVSSHRTSCTSDEQPVACEWWMNCAYRNLNLGGKK